MKPIVILQHEAGVSAGHFASWLAARSRPYVTIDVHAGSSLPSSAAPFAGICSLGGNMSVNDALPWIEPEIELMRDADRRGVPIIGHCLGGQLLPRALPPAGQTASIGRRWKVEHGVVAPSRHHCALIEMMEEQQIEMDLVGPIASP